MNLNIWQKSYLRILFLIVAVSKHLIILNEEILVACSFILFLVYSKNTFSSNIEEALSARTIALSSELQNHINVQIRIAKDLSLYHSYYAETRLSMETILNRFLFESKNLKKKTYNQVQNTLSLCTNDRIQTLITQNETYKRSLQKAIVSNFHNSSVKEA